VIQLISQLKGYFYINPLLSLSLAITIFSFVGIPPLVGFFAKQMVLSAALDNGYIFLTLIAIITSVIGAVYYLNVIKEIFFYSPEHEVNPILNESNSTLKSRIFVAGAAAAAGAAGAAGAEKNGLIKSVLLKGRNVYISSPFSITISIITNVILLFMFMNKELLSMGAVLAQTLLST
jgi:NADH-ubiquinone oxidoreductase chain 2